MSVPRDANQQFHVGRLTGTRWCTGHDAPRRHDLLHRRRRPRAPHGHLPGRRTKYIHAGSPVVGINSFNPDDDEYDERRAVAWAWARRVWD